MLTNGPDRWQRLTHTATSLHRNRYLNTGIVAYTRLCYPKMTTNVRKSQSRGMPLNRSSRPLACAHRSSRWSRTSTQSWDHLPSLGHSFHSPPGLRSRCLRLFLAQSPAMISIAPLDPSSAVCRLSPWARDPHPSGVWSRRCRLTWFCRCRFLFCCHFFAWTGFFSSCSFENI